jgi:drug/metabolite transporter (DMT)-like permease
MIYLVLAVVCNSLLFLILKSFDRFRINTLQGIVVNYAVAGSLGLLLSPVPFSFAALETKTWLWIPPIMGLLFISIFLLIARTAQTIGVSVASVANKMSVIIPVIVAILLYNDSTGFMKVAGIVLALVAVYFTSKKNDGSSLGLRQLFLPLVVFLGSGIIDALVNFAQQQSVSTADSPLFIACCFLMAFTGGVLMVSYQLVRKQTTLQPRALLAGIVLGVPNYFSIWCIIEALESQLMESSMLYPVANMGIVVVSTLGAFLLFREKLSPMNLLGIGISIAATLLIMFS